MRKRSTTATGRQPRQRRCQAAANPTTPPPITTAPCTCWFTWLVSEPGRVGVIVGPDGAPATGDAPHWPSRLRPCLLLATTPSADLGSAGAGFAFPSPRRSRCTTPEG